MSGTNLNIDMNVTSSIGHPVTSDPATTPGGASNVLLLESGDALLLEDGSFILLE